MRIAGIVADANVLLSATIGKAALRVFTSSDVADRDPDDAHPLALALQLRVSIWSNDNDLVVRGATRLTTAQLLAALLPRK